MVSLDTIFDLLSDERRRYALYYLYERDGPVPIEELVETIADWEDDPPEDDSWEKFDEIVVDLQHTHLPKTAEVEFIQYRRDKGVVQVQGAPPKFDAFVTVARLLEQPEDG
ncbi:hypothetical protein [Natrialba sp. PRR66]|uniref:DUF7344 domain-containing protein n=1 Tax=Natrialba sp. PRR66 TaxID=3098146 RepID=UPI002B1E7114|nr:hypothetical protein [Natrialba sp. PRR66]